MIGLVVQVQDTIPLVTAARDQGGFALPLVYCFCAFALVSRLFVLIGIRRGAQINAALFLRLDIFIKLGLLKLINYIRSQSG